MSNERALTIIEAAKAPQVVAVSSVSVAEIEFQGIWKQYKALVEQMQTVSRQYVALHENLVRAWFAENYPAIRYTFKSWHTENPENYTFNFGACVTIESPDNATIHQELLAYIDHLER